ncbi:MAG: ATP-binding protein [Campylobacterota bacterium]|nr:ATP-binding protein [Campylobacterota bacterium]
MKKLPIGIQTFKDIREDDYIYVDKTDVAYNLIDNYRYIFLSRPRRFGKSLFLDTLKNIFEGKKEYFKDLYIYDKWDWDVKYPVIKISFIGGVKSTDDLEEDLIRILADNQEVLNIECKDILSAKNCLSELIKKVYQKYNQKVVILIDEYDKPILDNVENIKTAKLIRDMLSGFYSVLKDSDQYIKFAFLTGVSKFSKASIFSGLNMLTDISLNPKYGNICGYTQKDIETQFLPYLDGVDLERLKNFYNGYNFLKDDIYNPFDILQFIDNDKVFKNYWFKTGTPTFLIKLIEKNNYFLPTLSNLIVDEKLLDSFDIENLDLEVILYQSGYLTIEEIKETLFGSIEYKLKIPNVEVKQSLYDVIIEFMTKNNKPNIYKTPLYKSLLTADLNELKNTLFVLFESIPYNNFTKNDIQNFEGFYASVIYTYLQSLGIRIIGEDVTNKGRIDLTCFCENKIYIIEFKVDAKTEGEALEQIKKKNYAQKYLTQSEEIYLVGIEFDSNKRNIGFFEFTPL